MLENIANFFKKLVKTETKQTPSKNTAKERLHLVLMQDRANVSADFLELMKQEIIEVIKKYIEVEETAIDVRLTNEVGEDGTQGAPSLYANIPILNIKNDIKKTEKKEENKKENKEEKPAEESKKNEEKVDDKEEIKDEEKTDKVEENKETENEVLEENKELKGEQEKVEEKQEENKEEKSAEESNKNEDKADENNENNTADKEE